MQSILHFWALSSLLSFLAVVIVCGIALWYQRGHHDHELELPHWLDKHILAATPAGGPAYKPRAQWRLAILHRWYHFRCRYLNALNMFNAICVLGLFGAVGVLLAWRG